MLTANQKYIDTANIKHLLGAGEKNADKIQIAVDRYYHQTDLSDCLFTLRAVNSGGGLVMQNLEKEVTESQIILTWTITEDFTAVSGQLLPEIVGQKDDTVVIKYEMTPMIVRNSILEQYNGGIDAIDKALREMQSILAQAEQLIVKAPIIQNGTWWLYDAATGVYQDSEQPAKGDPGKQGKAGAKGEKGDQGEPGAPGEKGERGEKGEKGDAGTPGKNGVNGKDGANGINGKDGVNGYSPIATVTETDAGAIITITDKTGTTTATVSSTLGERVRLYVDAEAGSDTNNGKTTTTAVQTIDRALVLANAYQQAIICLKKGQTYTATDKNNEYGTGIQLYRRTLRFEAYGTASDLPKIQNAIFAYNCNLEWKGIDLTGNSSVFTMYNTIANFENCSFYWVESRNSFAQVRLCDIQREWVQYGGFSVISNAESQYRHIGGIQANQGARIDYSGFGIGGYGYDGCSVLSIGCIPEILRKTKNIAESSIETKTIYVNADTGSDARDGTSEAKALQTLSRALQFTQYAGKAVIYLAAGTYTVPDKTWTLLGQDVRIYGDTAATTILQGNLVCENSFLLMRRVTIDSTDSTTANPTANTITLQYRAAIRMVDCTINTAGKNAINITEMSNANFVGTTFRGASQYAVYVRGLSDAKIYTCTDETTKGVHAGGGSIVYINNATGANFPYTNDSSEIVFVDGRQVLPKTTTVSDVAMDSPN